MHSLALLGQEHKGPHVNAAKFTGFPMCSHDAANGMGVRSEQEMTHLVGHNAAQNSGDINIGVGMKLLRSVPENVAVTAGPVWAQKGDAEGYIAG